MKMIIKKMYMFLFHPILFIRFGWNKNFFVNKRANIKNCSKMKVGENVTFGYDTRINFFDDTSKVMLDIGNGAYFCNRVSILVGGNIEIGENVLVASDVCITSENHGIDPMSDKPYKNQALICRDVKIGDGTWIGEKVVILPGVSIGEKCVVGAGSIVTKDVPDYSIVVGNPAKIIKYYDKETYKWVKIQR